ncbi:hypothetical protein CLAIMM_09321 [Cladophialophora immunda]|nr:hypothetical protein CLAIMM_09321 [Cladophialophora immunda]
MAPRGQSTTTPTRRMTRPSAMRRTPATPSVQAGSTSSSAIQGATGKATPARANRRNTTKSAPKSATIAAQSGRTPAKSASTNQKPKDTPAKKASGLIRRTKATAKANKKGDEGTKDEAPQTASDNNDPFVGADNGRTKSESPSVTPQPPTSIPARRNAKPKTSKRKSKPFEEQPYVNNDSSEDDSANISLAKAAPTPKGKAVAVEDKVYSEEEDTDEEHEDLVAKSATRKRKIRPFDDQAYRFEREDSEEDDDEELDDNVPGDLTTNPLRRIHLRVNQDRHQQQMRQLAERSTRESPANPSSSSGPRLPASPSTPGASQRAVQQPSVGPAPKRQRTASPTVASSSSPHGKAPQTNAVDPNDPLVLAEQLFTDIERTPRALDLDEIGALFMILQEKISRFCDDHFDFNLTAQQEKAWPMHLLATKYLSLMLMTQRIADGSEYGWHNFFTKREHRRHLVHGVIGEWFQQRIFKHTAFSIPDDKVRELEDMDRKYLHYDAFVRNKKKAECLEGLKIDEDYFPSAEFPNNFEHKDNLEIAARRMATNLLLVLEPLLPPPFFDPIVPRWRQSSRARDEGAEMRFQIWHRLIELIRMAGSLHLSIRFAGINGVVVRIAPHVPKGTRLRRDDAEKNICVNANWLNANSARPLQANDQLQVKMTCFGRVEAVVPNGLDVLELEQAQEAARVAGRELTREEAEKRLFNLYPYDLQETDAARDAVADLPAIPGTEWSTAILKAGIQEAREKRYGRRPREDATRDQADAKSGAFVTVYSRVAPSNLYCEWVASSQEQQFPPLANAAPQPPAQTLAEAVADARRQKHISCSLEDAGLAVWNTVARREFLEWLVFSGSVAGISAITAPWIRGVFESLNLAERSREVGTSISTRAGRAVSAAANWRSALQDASAYVSQLVAPTASTVTMTSVVTDWTTTTVQVDEPTDVGELMEEVTPTSATSRDSFSELLPEALRGVLGITRRVIATDNPEFAMVASLFSEQMGFVQQAETQAAPEPEPTPSPSTRRSKVL